MPVISVFYGIIVKIYYSDHNPPHFHAQYADSEVIIEIKTGRIVHGQLPKRLLGFLELWRRENLEDIINAWNNAQALKSPGRVKPLE